MNENTRTFATAMHEERRTRVVTYVDEMAKTSLQEAGEWSRDAMRTLIILNGAGLAACATLIAANMGESIRTIVSISAGAFSAGLVCALFVMVWRWFVFGTMATELLVFAHEFALNHAPIEKMETLANPWRVRFVTYVLAIASFIAFLSGTWLTFHVLRSPVDSVSVQSNSVIAYRFKIPDSQN